MNIGIIIGRIGGVDGVALETEKWIEVLKRLGHKVYIITGLRERPLKEHITIVDEMNFYHHSIIIEQNNVFFLQNVPEPIALQQINQTTLIIQTALLNWISKNKIHYLISENASALPCHLSMGQAIHNVLVQTQLPCLNHDHDFAWERKNRYKTKFKTIQNLIQKIFPTKLHNVQHAVINYQTQRDLFKKGIPSIVIPNVMDFQIPYGQPDLYNQQIKSYLGLNESDILLFQITRIVKRKGIETAIELIHKLSDPNVKLIITGTPTDDHNQEYYSSLMKLVKSLKLENQVLFESQHFANYRDPKHNLFSLSDAYSVATACTYFSTYEGFGNAFVECVLAKKPIFVNNYQPVYWENIGSLGFKTVMIEDNHLTDKAVKDIRQILYDKDLRRFMTEENFEIGKKYFSYEVLEEKLKQLIK